MNKENMNFRYLHWLGAIVQILFVGYFAIIIDFEGLVVSRDFATLASLLVLPALSSIGIGRILPNYWYISGLISWAVVWSRGRYLFSFNEGIRISSTAGQDIIVCTAVIMLTLFCGYIGSKIGQLEPKKEPPLQKTKDYKDYLFNLPVMQTLYRPFSKANPHLLIIIALIYNYLLFALPALVIVYEPVRGLPNIGVPQTSYQTVPSLLLENDTLPTTICSGADYEPLSTVHNRILNVTWVVFIAMLSFFSTMTVFNYIIRLQPSLITFTVGLIIYAIIPFAFASHFLSGAPYRNCGGWPIIRVTQLYPFWPTLVIYVLSFLPAFLIEQRVNDVTAEKDALREEF